MGQPSNAPKPRLASICYSVPYEGIEHAGGEFILRHLRHLSNGMDVSVLAYDTDFNRSAMAKSPSEIQSITLTPRAWWGPSFLGRALKRAVRDLFPLVPDADYTVGFQNSPLAEGILASADVVDIQYVEYFHLVNMVRRSAPDAKVVGVVHDIVSERYARLIESKSKRHISVIGRLTYKFVARTETRLCNSVDELLVFNDDTARKLKALGVKTKFVIARPPLTDMAMPRTVENLETIQPFFVFVGAFGRPENEQGAIWFITEIWPNIIRGLQGASLAIVGANPSTELRRASEQQANVEVTGYVENLNDYYRKAGIVVVPLLRGAGVKFKTLTAMLWGKPVIATPVGAEGIADESCYFGITDDPVEFARLAISAVQEPQKSGAAARRAHAWAHSGHNNEQYTAALNAVYIDLPARAP